MRLKKIVIVLTTFFLSATFFIFLNFTYNTSDLFFGTIGPGNQNLKVFENSEPGVISPDGKLSILWVPTSDSAVTTIKVAALKRVKSNKGPVLSWTDYKDTGKPIKGRSKNGQTSVMDDINAAITALGNNVKSVNYIRKTKNIEVENKTKMIERFRPTARISTIPKLKGFSLQISDQTKCEGATLLPSEAFDPLGTLECHWLLFYVSGVRPTHRKDSLGEDVNNEGIPAQALIKVVVDAYENVNGVMKRKDNPRVEVAKVDPFRLLFTSGPEKDNKEVEVKKIVKGHDLSLSGDGRLLILPVDEIGLAYSFNENPAGDNSDEDIWSTPKSFSTISGEKNEKICVNFKDNGSCVNKFKAKFSDVYPIAKQRIRLPEGNLIPWGPSLTCDYAWFSPDMSEGFCQGTYKSNLMVFGKRTNYQLKFIDGPVNYSTKSMFCNGGGSEGEEFRDRLVCNSREDEGITNDDSDDNQSEGGSQAGDSWYKTFKSLLESGVLTKKQVSCFCSNDDYRGLDQVESFGTTRGVWSIYNDMNSDYKFLPKNENAQALLVRNEQLYPLSLAESNISSTGSNPLLLANVGERITKNHKWIYQEMTYDDTSDTNYHVYYPMTELLEHNFSARTGTRGKGSTSNWKRTPDISAKIPTSTQNDDIAFKSTPRPCNMKLLGAVHPYELRGEMEGGLLNGYIGRATYFPTGGYTQTDTSSCIPTNNATHFSIEFAIRTLANFNSGETKILSLNNLTLSIRNSNSNNIRKSTLIIEASDKIVELDLPKLINNTWNHLVLSYNNTRFVVYQNGQGIVAKNKPAGLNSVDLTGRIVIGNMRVTGSVPAMLIDEVAISKVARGLTYAKKMAFHPADSPGTAYLGLSNNLKQIFNSIPSGLSLSEFFLPKSFVAKIWDTSEPKRINTKNSIVSLGRLLFNSNSLSTNKNGVSNNRSCVGCHRADNHFADKDQISPIALGSKPAVLLGVNTPTLVNRSFGKSFFFDGRAKTLEQAVLIPIVNPHEMGGDFVAIQNAINTPGKYPAILKAYKATFGNGAKTNDQFKKDIAMSLAAFISTLNSATAVAVDNNVGAYIFNNKGRCVGCHSGGNFSDEQFWKTGFNTKITGRYSQTGSSFDKNAVKTPSLRGISSTNPFISDGSMDSLEDVVNQYSDGTSGHPSAEIVPLGLTDDEKAALVQFLEGL